ncbi:DUF1598 domain-containing protein [bacterium]|nr:DUF1598 domain-containing protein [bacterium]
MLLPIRAGIVASLMLAFTLFSGFPSRAFGQNQVDPNAILAEVQSYSRVGEFSRAFQEVSKLPTPSQRDQGHSAIIDQQIKAGLIQAAVETSSYVEDDQLRTDLLSQASSARRQEAKGFGGGVQPNFTQLIDLITTTVEPDSWDELGGPGTIAPFSTGVYVDGQGTLKRVTKLSNDTLLSSVHDASQVALMDQDLSKASPLRKVSLTRLEKEAQLRWAIGQKPTEEMMNLAGIYEVKYLFVYPESGEIVLAGPAGPWKTDAEGRLVNQDNGRPVLQLDDLVVLLRNSINDRGRFGCSITPTQDGLKNAQEYLQTTSAKPIHPRMRDQWLEGLRSAVGKQKITTHGVTPDTRVGQVIVEADYHMKRIGMGLEDGTAGVPSYLELVKIPPGGSAPPMDVLRWWFTPDYRSVNVTPKRDAFELDGPGVECLSENEMLDAQGKRIHTNTSTAINATFAHNFSQHYDALSVKYPIYADMKNIFDLAIVCSIIHTEHMADKSGWHMTHFGPNGAYEVQKSAAPQDVESIMNMRLIDKIHIIAGVSGGVNFDPANVLAAEKVDDYGLMAAEHKESALPKTIKHHGWWWD